MTAEATGLPRVWLSRWQTVRLIVVAILVAVALAPVVPDLVRFAYPLHLFGYDTDANGVVETLRPEPSSAPAAPLRVAGARARHAVAAKPGAEPVDALRVGDRVRVDRIRPFDRKPGLVLHGWTYDNPDRYLPIERAGRERIVHLRAVTESATARFTDMLRIVLFVAAVALGALLFVIKPSIATASFFVFCLGAVEAPATYLETLVPMPWRPLVGLTGDFLHGVMRPALLLFALCLIDGDTDDARERAFAVVAGALGIALGALSAFVHWRVVYAGLPAGGYARVVAQASVVVGIATVCTLVVAFWRARWTDRQRIGWIAAAFVLAGLARLASDQFYPARIPFWFNSVLVSVSIVPIVTIWIGVLRHRFFDVDFVVTRAVVYVALTGALLGTISIIEEIGTYIFYMNSDWAYAALIAVSIAVGAFTGKLKEILDHSVDRFIFRDRRTQRQALEFIAGYILDAETVEDVHRALLQDATHALKLAFAGILGKRADGSFALDEQYAWPESVVIRLSSDDDLARAIARSRGALTFTAKDTRLIRRTFPHERLAFAGPLFSDREVSGIVVYGHNVSGLELDPEEVELLVRVVAHASIALTTIELNRLREAASAAPAAVRAVT